MADKVIIRSFIFVENPQRILLTLLFIYVQETFFATKLPPTEVPSGTTLGTGSSSFATTVQVGILIE